MKFKCVNIVSPDPKRLADFYQNILGANIDESHGGASRIELWFGDKEPSYETVFIVVNYNKDFIPKKINACQGFEIHVPDVDVEYTRISALGIVVNEPPNDLPWGYRYFNINDPDGNGIDIVAKSLITKTHLTTRPNH